jgi:hypothetical protein
MERHVRYCMHPHEHSRIHRRNKRQGDVEDPREEGASHVRIVQLKLVVELAILLGFGAGVHHFIIHHLPNHLGAKGVDHLIRAADHVDRRVVTHCEDKETIFQQQPLNGDAFVMVWNSSQ